MERKTKIIVGLGNVGGKYCYNYHNMGFLAIECLAERLNIKLKKKLCASLCGIGVFQNSDVVLAQPQTYMNNSGIAVRSLLGKFGASLSDLIVVFDDIDIEQGAIRVRQSGSGGTHNGMRNIIEQLDSTEFARVRIGIGKPPENVLLHDYVLSDVPKDKRELMAAAIEQAADKVLELIKEG